MGNLIHRNDYGSGFSENYAYDRLNRLTDAWSDYGDGNIQHTTVSYDALGNITYKSGVGQYDYGTQESSCGRVAGPHAVTRITPTGAGDSKDARYCYDANGNMTQGDGRFLSYTSFEKPDYIEKGSHSTAMAYGAARRLVHRHDVDTDSGIETETFLLGGLYERVITHGGPDTGRVEERHYVSDAIVTYSHDVDGIELRTPTDERRYYTHADHLGSIVTITNEIGRVVERMNFDAWGKRRAVMQPTLDELLAIDPFNFSADPYELKSQFTERGFTGHQQLDGVGIVHMGGRIYDAEIGRFLQADPFVQDSTNLQGLNRYSYVENNPLSYTDPSGYFLKKLFKKIGKFISRVGEAIVKHMRNIFRAIARVKWLSNVISFALNFVPGCQQWCSYAFNAAMSAANASSFGGFLKGVAIGQVTGRIGGGIGNELRKYMGQEFAQGAGQLLSGGIAAKAHGGKFIDGVKGAAKGIGIASGANKIAGWVKGVGETKATNKATKAQKAPTVGGNRQISSDVDGDGVADISFVNDDPNGASTDLAVRNELATMVEDVVRDTGLDININSTVRGPCTNSAHCFANAVDINRINGMRVDNPANLSNVTKLQNAFQNHANIRENYGPAFNLKTVGPGQVQNRASSSFIVNLHKDHIHASATF